MTHFRISVTMTFLSLLAWVSPVRSVPIAEGSASLLMRTVMVVFVSLAGL